MEKPPQLKAVEHDKRKVKDEPIFLDQKFLKDLLAMVNRVEWPYRTNIRELQLRDKALVCLFILTGIRNSEREQLYRKKFRIYDTHILLVNMQSLKHGLDRDEIIMPKTGGLSPFTLIFEQWLKLVPDKDSVIFPTANPDGTFNWTQHLSRQRVHRIIKKTTGMFPHWFRGVCASIYGKIIFKRDAWKLKEFMGWANLNSSSPYVGGSWTENKKDVFNVKID